MQSTWRRTCCKLNRLCSISHLCTQIFLRPIKSAVPSSPNLCSNRHSILFNSSKKGDYLSRKKCNHTQRRREMSLALCVSSRRVSLASSRFQTTPSTEIQRVERLHPITLPKEFIFRLLSNFYSLHIWKCFDSSKNHTGFYFYPYAFDLALFWSSTVNANLAVLMPFENFDFSFTESCSIIHRSKIKSVF